MTSNLLIREKAAPITGQMAGSILIDFVSVITLEHGMYTVSLVIYKLSAELKFCVLHVEGLKIETQRNVRRTQSELPHICHTKHRKCVSIIQGDAD